MADPGQPPYPVRTNEPDCPPLRGSHTDLQATVGYGGMHLCRYGDCGIWVADGGDHRCVLHSAEPWARTVRQSLATRPHSPSRPRN